MNKKLLYAGLLFGSMITASNAQVTTLLNEGFENTAGWTPATSWKVQDMDGDGINWGVYNDPAINAVGFTGKVIGSASVNAAGPLTPDNILISPLITIPAGGSAQLTFKLAAFSPTAFAEHYAIYAAEGEDEPDLDTPIVEETLTSGGSGTLVTKTVNLSAFVGKTITLYIRHFNTTNQRYIFMDDMKVTHDTALGTGEFLAGKFAAYPNPAKDIITLTNDLNAQISDITITDLNGRIVKQNKYNNANQVQVNVSDLTKGLYIMTINSDKGSLTKKVLKD